ncbi:MAG: hypothetical protein LBG88_03110 [Christensenellaceae bacterium]|jgi:hypothetical protein|nr:hypothetical protein [Christensenellaceae bacterium]
MLKKFFAAIVVPMIALMSGIVLTACGGDIEFNPNIRDATQDAPTFDAPAAETCGGGGTHLLSNMTPWVGVTPEYEEHLDDGWEELFAANGCTGSWYWRHCRVCARGESGARTDGYEVDWRLGSYSSHSGVLRTMDATCVDYGCTYYECTRRVSGVTCGVKYNFVYDTFLGPHSHGTVDAWSDQCVHCGEDFMHSHYGPNGYTCYCIGCGGDEQPHDFEVVERVVSGCDRLEGAGAYMTICTYGCGYKPEVADSIWGMNCAKLEDPSAVEHSHTLEFTAQGTVTYKYLFGSTNVTETKTFYYNIVGSNIVLYSLDITQEETEIGIRPEEVRGYFRSTLPTDTSFLKEGMLICLWNGTTGAPPTSSPYTGVKMWDGKAFVDYEPEYGNVGEYTLEASDVWVNLNVAVGAQGCWQWTGSTWSSATLGIDIVTKNIGTFNVICTINEHSDSVSMPYSMLHPKTYSPTDVITFMRLRGTYDGHMTIAYYSLQLIYNDALARIGEANYTDLKDTNTQIYSTASWTTYRLALTSARMLLEQTNEDDFLASDKLHAKEHDLQVAMEGLITLAYSNLEKYYLVVKDLDGALYSADAKWATFATRLSTAQALLVDNNKSDRSDLMLTAMASTLTALRAAATALEPDDKILRSSLRTAINNLINTQKGANGEDFASGNYTTETWLPWERAKIEYPKLNEFATAQELQRVLDGLQDAFDNLVYRPGKP